MAKKILVIDDDPDIQEILSLILTDEGYQVIACRTKYRRAGIELGSKCIYQKTVYYRGPFRSGKNYINI